MTEDTGIQTIVDALGLPSEALVDARVPKKLFIEQGAPTTADKRSIQEGVPATISTLWVTGSFRSNFLISGIDVFFPFKGSFYGLRVPLPCVGSPD